MPEFKNDFTLPLENDFTKIFLDAEIEKTHENYNEILNYIDCKSTSEIVVYEEYLKQLKEKLASKGIFPSKFDEIKINTSCIYTPIFDSFSMESKNHPEYNGMIPESVQKTKRIFPYLYAKYFKDRNIKAAKKILEDFKIKEDEEQNAAYFYKEASRLLTSAYSSYCDENYQSSCTAFEESIPFWRKYYELVNMQQSAIDASIGIIKLLQGSSAIEFDFDYAKSIFNNSIGNFYGYYAFNTYYSYRLVAETFYRQNDIKGFIGYMNSIQNKVPLRENLNYSSFLVSVKSQIIQFEFERLSKPFIYSTQDDLNKHQKILDRIANTESNLSNDSEGRYIKKTLIRYKEIMAKNLLEIKAIGFDHYSTSTKHYIKLKKHDDDQVIQTPQWLVKTNPNDNTVKLEVQPIAAVRNEKIRIQVIVGAQGTPADVIGEYKLTGYDTVNKIEFNVVAVKKNKSNLLIECESDKEISKTVGIFLLDIKWHLIKPERKENSSIIKDFYLGNTQHTIYIVRKYIEEPCYWKIVEHTCDWIKNLSESDLDDDDKVVDAIWNGCSIENLTDLGYKYKYPPTSNDPTTLAELLDRQKGACGLWANFLIHCFYCQGIEGITNVKRLQLLYNGELTRFKYYDVYKPIGNVVVPPFDDHVVVGYKGSYDVYTQSYYGIVYDPVFHIKCDNKITEYEDMAVEFIEDVVNNTWVKKQIGTKQFNFRMVEWEKIKNNLLGR